MDVSFYWSGANLLNIYCHNVMKYCSRDYHSTYSQWGKGRRVAVASFISNKMGAVGWEKCKTFFL